jgi:hypothetical protein
VGDGLCDATTQKNISTGSLPPCSGAPWRNHVEWSLCPDVKTVLTAFADAIHERDRRHEMRKYREMYRLDMGSDTQGADQVEAIPPPPLGLPPPLGRL